MKNLKLETKGQLVRVRNNVYGILDVGDYIYDKDKFVQQVIKNTFNETKKELLSDLFNEWIKCNNGKEPIDFFMLFEKKFRADLQRLKYKNEPETI